MRPAPSHIRGLVNAGIGRQIRNLIVRRVHFNRRDSSWIAELCDLLPSGTVAQTGIAGYKNRVVVSDRVNDIRSCLELQWQR